MNSNNYYLADINKKFNYYKNYNNYVKEFKHYI